LRKTRQFVFSVVCETGVSSVSCGVWRWVPGVGLTCVLSSVPVALAIVYSSGCGGCSGGVVVTLGVGGVSSVRVAVVACSKIETSIMVSRIGEGRGGHFFLGNSPSVVFVGRDFATFQEIPERVSRVNAVIGCVSVVIRGGVCTEEVKVGMLAFSCLRADAIIAVVGSDSKALGVSLLGHSWFVLVRFFFFAVFHYILFKGIKIFQFLVFGKYKYKYIAL